MSKFDEGIFCMCVSVEAAFTCVESRKGKQVITQTLLSRDGDSCQIVGR